MHVKTWTVLLIVVLYMDVVQSRGGRGGGRRGENSGSRGRSIIGSSSGNSFRAKGGGMSSYASGSGIGSMASSNVFKGFVMGAAAGYVTNQAGRSVISFAAAPMMWNGRPYYWDQAYYQRSNSKEMCSMPLNSTSDSTFNNVYFKDGQRPTQIVWGCTSYEQDCCGFECCEQDLSWYWIVVIVVGIVLFCFFCCYICGGWDAFWGKDGSVEKKQTIPVVPASKNFTHNGGSAQDKCETVAFI